MALHTKTILAFIKERKTHPNEIWWSTKNAAGKKNKGANKEESGSGGKPRPEPATVISFYGKGHSSHLGVELLT